MAINQKNQVFVKLVNKENYDDVIIHFKQIFTVYVEICDLLNASSSLGIYEMDSDNRKKFSNAAKKMHQIQTKAFDKYYDDLILDKVAATTDKD